MSSVREELWSNGNNSYHGMNDKIAEAEAAQLGGFLLLIEPEKLLLHVGNVSR